MLALPSLAACIESSVFLSPTMSLDLKNWIGGSAVTEAGIEIADFDGNGSSEIVTSAKTVPGNGNDPSYWYIVEQVDGVFRTTYTSELFPDLITWLTILDYNRDGRPDVCVSAANKIYVYDGPTKQKLATISAPHDILQFAGADLDGDGVTEFVFTDQADMVVYSEFGLEQRVPSLWADRYAIGNLFPDRTPEIVLARATQGIVLNGRTRATLMTFPQGLGIDLHLADFNGDSLDDMIAVVGVDTFTYIRGFTSLSRTAVWQTPVPQGITNFRVGDVDNDGTLEVVIATDSLDGIVVLNARTGALEWTLDYGPQSFGTLAIGNLDTDPAKEIALGSGVSSTGRNGLDILDAGEKAIQWQSRDYDSFRTVGHGDIDGDGNPEYLLVADTLDGSGGGAFLVQDSLTGFTEYASNALPGRIQSATVANIDSDPQLEIFVSSNNFGSKRLFCFDGLTHAQQYQVSTGGQDTYDLVAADLDNDQDIELISPTINSNQITIRNAQTGATEWTSGSLPAFVGRIEVANVAADPQLEIIGWGSDLVVIDGISHAPQWNTTGLGDINCAVYDLDGNSIKEILVCSASGRVTVRNSTSGAESSLLGTFGPGITAFDVEDVLGTTEPDIILFQNKSILVKYKDESNQSQSFQAPTGLTSDARFYVGDIDGDGRLNLILSTFNVGVTAFSLFR